MGTPTGRPERAPVRSYRDLEVWQLAMDLVENCYQLSRRLPMAEQFGLAAQIQRAAVSVPANIAEGNARSYTGDYLHHLSMAHGSLKELETHLLIAVRLRYLNGPDVEATLRHTERLGRMLTSLMQKLRARKR